MGENKRAIILLSAFNFLLWASLGVLAPIEVLFLDSLTHSTVIKGLILGIPSIVLLALAPYVTRFSERHGMKRVILALIMLSSPFFVLLPYSPSYQVYGLLKVFSSLLFLASPILFAYMSGIGKRLGIGYGSVILASSIGGGLGSLISGLAGEMLGLGIPYIILAGFSLASALFILPLREMKVVRHEGGGKVGRFDVLLMAVLANSMIFSFHLSARAGVWPLVLGSITDAPAFFSGLVFSLMGLAAAILSVPSGLAGDRFGENRIFFMGWWIMALAGIMLFFATGSVYLFLLFSVVYAVGEILKGPSSAVILARYRKPVYFGYSSSMGSLGGILGAVVSGALIYLFGVYAAVLGLGLIVLFSLIPFFLAHLFQKRS